MAAVVEPKDAAAKFSSQVDEQLAQATSRIRAHDLAFGGLVLAALVLIYATAMIVLDRYLVLAESVRQLALAGFVATLAGTAYLTLLSPLRKRINPLYAAKQVERTIDDAKNSVTGYVDAREKGDLNATVKAALASRAAQAAAEADVNKAVDHRSLIYVGGVVIAFLLTLIVLFFVFRPAPFASLFGRTFAPFTPRVIETRTHIRLMKPEPAEPTITVGQTITVAVYVEGKVPKPDGPEKVRLLIRHNQADPNYDELPMVQGETSRDWELRVPDYLVQNGFWYKVAAGDDVTPEYKVTVRSLPRFDTFRTTYDYPKYLHLKSVTTDDPVLKGYRGTTVTLVGKTNRDVRDGLMVIEPSNARVAGVPDPTDPTALKFVFKLSETGKYKLTFTATNGERTIDPFQGVITVETDAAPQVVINKPEQDEVTEPANGQVKIDGKIGDDFGIDTVTLKMKIVFPVERPLADVPYLNGKSTSFRREQDNTYPTDVDYKGSIDLAKITKDAEGRELKLEAETVIEYWLEATDNCTEPKANVGVSTKKRVRLTPPKVEEMEKQNLDEQKQNRQQEEKKHNEDQQQKLDQEKRDQNKGQQPQKGDAKNEPKKDGKPDPMGDKGDKGNETPKPMGGMPENPPKTDMGTPKNPPEPKMDPMMPGTPEMGMNPMGPMDNPMKGPKTDPKPDAKNDEKGNKDQGLDKTAKELQDELNRDKQDGGTGKPNNTPDQKDRTEPGQPKPQPKDGMEGMNNAADPKPEPKQPKNDPTNPMGKNEAPPSEGRSEGDLQKPQDPATPKPEPKKDDKSGKNAPSENRNEPVGAAPGEDKPQPKEQQPQPKDPNAKQDPNSGACAKPDTQKKDGNPSGMGMNNAGDKKSDPAADAGSKAKPMQEPNRGTEKPSTPQKGARPNDPNNPPKPEDKTPGEPDAGDAKPQKGPPAGDAKPQPKEGPMAKGNETDPKPDGGANNPKKPNETSAAEAKPDEGKKGDATAGGKPVEKGADKPAPKDEKSTAKAGGAPPPKEKMDEKTRKELEQAANDLVNGDEQQKKEAREKLDKAVGEEKRKEFEKLANDLKSPDDKTRKDAEQKLKEMKDKMAGDKKDGAGAGQPMPKEKELTAEEKKELEKAANDLVNGDEKQKQEARDKLDKMIGKENREAAEKEAEQLKQDLMSDDKEKKAAAQKKLEELKKKAEEHAGKGGMNEPKTKQPTPEEINDLAKKAQDLQSTDDEKRKQAQRELDDRIGEEQRKQLEEMMKNQKPGDKQQDEKLKKQLEEMAKNPPKKPEKDWTAPGPGAGTQNKGPMEEDPKNRLKSAELALEEFKKEENKKLLQNKKGWTDAEYEKFLKDYEDFINREREALKKDEKAPTPTPKDPSNPMFNSVTSGKVDPLAAPGTTGPAGIGGPAVAPPGFDKVRDKFQKALEEAQKNKKP